jgi:hypothetical protein
MHLRFFKIAGLIFLFASLPAVSAAQPITFAKVVTIKAGAGPRSIALGDFNRDGKSDVAVTNSSSKTVTVLRANGNGTFTQTASIPFSTAPMFVVAADLDGDGNLDLAVADSNTTANSTVTILLGNGNGTFSAQPPISLGLSSFNHSMAVGDFNRDGKLDIVVTNDQSNVVSILLGNGDGTFAVNSLTLPNVNKPLSVAVGDFDGDGNLDLALADGNTVLAVAGLGDGSFDTPLDLTQKNSPGFVTVADFNRDGIPDLAITSLTDKKIIIRLGTSDGTFAGTSSSRDVPATPQFIIAADFNGDGKLDVAAMLAGNFISVFEGTGDGNINAGQNLPVKGASFSAVAADFTGDGKPDILSANFQTGGFSLLTNLTAFVLGGAFGDATDFDITANQGISPAHAPEALAVGDFNRDGKLDLVTANNGNDNVSVFLGDGTGTFALTGESPFSAGTAPNGVATGDFNGDGILDLAVANSGSDNNVSIFLGNGNGTFDPASTPTVPADTTPAAVTVGDFNGDGKIDLAVANNGSDNVSVLLGNGDGSFQSAINSSVGTHPIALASGDFNRDGVPDLAVVNSGGGVSILLGVGNGNFTQPIGSPFGVGTTPSAVAIGDFDSDGIPDVAVANSGSSNVSVLLGNGDGTFAAAVNFTVGSSPSSVAAADWDGDGKLDLAVGNAGNDSVSILFGDGAGGFSSALATAFGSPFAVGSTPSAVVAGDFNRDGRPDLAAANADGDNISILLNTAPPPVVIAPLAGAVWTIGSTQTIRWSNPGAGTTVNIWLSRDGGATWKTILKKSANDGTQTWKVAKPASGGNNAIIRICPIAKGPVCAGPSSDPFTIQ